MCHFATSLICAYTMKDLVNKEITLKILRSIFMMFITVLCLWTRRALIGLWSQLLSFTKKTKIWIKNSA